jgi:death-on-curing protein
VSDWIPLDRALTFFRAVTGLEPHVRDLGALDSSLARPFSTFAGVPFYPTLDEKAAALLESVNRNHPLLDGNKRLGWMLVRLLYLSYGVDPAHLPPDAEIDTFVRRVASDEVPFDEIVAWLRATFGTPGE